MNSRHSPLVTGRLAIACGWSRTLVPRPLAVEGETVVRADLDDSGAAGKEAQRLGRVARRGRALGA